MTENTNPQFDQAAAWHHRAMLAADAAQQARDEQVAYANDARRAYQQRMDNISTVEAQALRSLQSNPLAELVTQLRAAVSQPPVVVNAGQQ